MREDIMISDHASVCLKPNIFYDMKNSPLVIGNWTQDRAMTK